jgi:hypothetical protein
MIALFVCKRKPLRSPAITNEPVAVSMGKFPGLAKIRSSARRKPRG